MLFLGSGFTHGRPHLPLSHRRSPHIVSCVRIAAYAFRGGVLLFVSPVIRDLVFNVIVALAPLVWGLVYSWPCGVW